MSLSTIKTGLGDLTTMVVATYEHFSVSNHWALKCDSLLNTLVKEGSLTVAGINTVHPLD
jgi:hypothetical protein